MSRVHNFSATLAAAGLLACDSGPGPVVPPTATVAFELVAAERSDDFHSASIVGTVGGVRLSGHYTTDPCVDVTASVSSSEPGRLLVAFDLEPSGGLCIAISVQHHFRADVVGLTPGRYEVVAMVRGPSYADTLRVATARAY